MITEPIVETAIEAEDFLGESPVWSSHEQVLYWINCERPARIARFDPASSAVTTWPMPERIGAIALVGNGRLLVALASGVFDFDPASGSLELRARSPLPDNLVLHEGKCDRDGRFWVGTIDQGYLRTGQTGAGVWLRLTGETLVPSLFDVTVANGLAWSPDGATMYRADSISRQVIVHSYDRKTGIPGPGRLFADIAVEDGMPDGAAIDADGCYWLALFMGRRLRRYRPDGSIEREISLPISKPTMPAFAGAKLSTIYVTSTRHGERDGSEPGLGNLYRLDVGIGGLAEPVFDKDV